MTGCSLLDQMEKFWKVEECQIDNPMTAEEQICEKEFVKNTKYLDQGRYQVHLPFRRSPSELGESYSMALRRFHAMERKFAKDPSLRSQYIQFLKEYESMGHMIEIRNHDDSFNQVYYLPHHAVCKQSSTTTKLRVVFDASCKTSTGLSLNDILRVGPTIQQDLFAILMRFRQYPYVIAADIRQMYRQVEVAEEHQDLQRILWREDPAEPVKIFKLRTVTYGLASSPFLAIRCLHQIALDKEDEFPEASQIIRRDFYVDDLLTGANTEEHLQRIKRQVSLVLQSASFPLHKWRSNLTTLMDENDPGNKLIPQPDEQVKTLGVVWNPRNDQLQYSSEWTTSVGRVTKRGILSVVSRIFDPLGLASPLIIRAKIMLQELWQLKIGWDEAVPLNLRTQWLEYIKQLPYLQEIKIPRTAIINNPIQVEMHGFCDASERAYGACIYLVSGDALGNRMARLLCAKSKVAPLKEISLPRLELCGALLLARLHQKTAESLTISIKAHSYWCDSTITLAWIA